MKIKDLSIIILTHINDKRFIKSLASSQFAQEIIVIDHQSGNNWKKLAKQYQFRLIKYPYQLDDFSKLRNLAIAKVKTKWLLFLDSDEYLEDKAANKIKKLIKQDCEAWIVQRQDIFNQKKLRFGEWGKKKLIRLATQDSIVYQRPIHEYPVIFGKICYSQIKIFHQAHININDFFTDIARYAQLEADYRLTPSRIHSFRKNFYIIRQIIEIIFFPLLKFINNYFLKLAYLDAWEGFVYSCLMSWHSLLVRLFCIEKLINKDIGLNQEVQSRY